MAVTRIRCAKQARTTRRFDPWFRAFEAWTEITNLSPWIRRAARHHHQHWRWCQCLHCPFGHCNIATHPTTPLSFITLIMLIITILSPPPPLPMKSLQHRPPKIPGSRLGLNSIYIRIIMVWHHCILTLTLLQRNEVTTLIKYRSLINPGGKALPRKDPREVLRNRNVVKSRLGHHPKLNGFILIRRMPSLQIVKADQFCKHITLSRWERGRIMVRIMVRTWW